MQLRVEKNFAKLCISFHIINFPPKKSFSGGKHNPAHQSPLCRMWLLFYRCKKFLGADAGKPYAVASALPFAAIAYCLLRKYSY